MNPLLSPNIEQCDDPVGEIRAALETFDVNPFRICWLYVHAAFAHHGHSVSGTARALGMSRRTMQRQLQSKAPPKRWME